MCHKIRAFDVSRQLSSSLFRPLPASRCLREMKLHLDNTVGGGQRAANGPRCCGTLDIARRPFFFPLRSFSFYSTRRVAHER